MEICRRVIRFLCFCMGIFLLVPRVKAENMSEPLKNVNLSPIWQWRSAYECMLNVSGSCSDKDQIKLSGAVDVNSSEVKEYCKAGGCAEHVYYVLRCIYYAKRDFWFANKATVKYLNDTISQGCATNSGFNTTVITSSAMKTHWSSYATIASAGTAVVFITIFNM